MTSLPPLKPVTLINLASLTESELWGLLGLGYDVVDELQLRLLARHLGTNLW